MVRFRFLLKGVVVGALALLLLVPLAMINSTIGERQAYRSDAVRSVGRSFAGAQALVGPVLVVPYTERVQVKRKDRNDVDVVTTEVVARRWIFFPRTLAVDGKLAPSERKLGLFRVRVYELQANIAARFEARIPLDPAQVRTIGTPWLSMGLADVRGIAGDPKLQVDGTAVPLGQGIGAHRSGGGLHALLATPVPGQSMAFAARLDLALRGTETLAVAPIADSNQINLASTWPHPHFDGSFLPRGSDISDAGFKADWQVSSLAASSQAQYRAGDDFTAIDHVGVGLVDPVNTYSQVDRASKYGLLFVLLTFVGFFMLELVKRLQVHPIQYTLVGLALAIFFLLLLSLSEHVAFWIAYLVASVACIGLLGVYLSAALRSVPLGIGFSSGLALLYAALYGLLVSEDNALVLGALMLFAILAALMIATRRIDWYALADGDDDGLSMRDVEHAFVEPATHPSATP